MVGVVVGFFFSGRFSGGVAAGVSVCGIELRGADSVARGCDGDGGFNAMEFVHVCLFVLVCAAFDLARRRRTHRDVVIALGLLWSDALVGKVEDVMRLPEWCLYEYERCDGWEQRIRLLLHFRVRGCDRVTRAGAMVTRDRASAFEEVRCMEWLLEGKVWRGVRGSDVA